MTQALLIERPSPFAPTKQLQDFIDRWEGAPERNRPAVKLALEACSQELERRRQNPRAQEG